MADERDPYQTLEVARDASDDVIKAAYRRLARMYHPDLAPGAEAAVRMKAINVAWEQVGEPAARRRHDISTGVRDSAEPARPTASTTRRAPAPPPARPAPPRPAPPPEQVSRDWTSGRSSTGGGYDPSMHAPDGLGAAGPPPGRPSGSVLNFGRYAGWSLGEIARTDLEFVEWLDRMPIGRPYRDEIDFLLRRSGRRASDADEASERRGLFRRR